MADVDTIKYRAKNDAVMLRNEHEALDSNMLRNLTHDYLGKSSSATGKMVLSSNPEKEAYATYYYSALAEMTNEIQKERESQEIETKQAKKAWDEWKQGQIDEKVLSMKYSATANGQLIAAILEDEDGKTEQELSGWCEELTALEQKELREILEGLVREGTLKKSGAKYWLQRIFDGTVQLFQDYPAEYVQKHLADPDDEFQYMKVHRMILQLIRYKESICIFDVLNATVYQDEKTYADWTAYSYEAHFEEKMEPKCYLGDGVERNKGLNASGQQHMAVHYLNKLIEKGVIEKTTVSGTDWYHFPRVK